MPPPRPPREYLQKVCDAYHASGGNLEKTAKAVGKVRSTIQVQMGYVREMGLVPTIIPRDNLAEAQNDNLQAIIANLTADRESIRNELDVVKRALADAVRPRFTVRSDNVSRHDTLKVIVIGDAHDSPHIPDKSRFELIGAHINAVKPDVVIQIGDFATLDSLNTHDANHTAKGRGKPTFSEDMVSFNLALDALSSKLNYQPELHCTLGNHERRIWTFENEHPELSRDMQFRLFEVLERHKWTSSPYGMITYYGGVGYVHAALNSLGKTFGGKNSEATIANESVHDLTVGHSHRERPWRAAKLGGNNYVIVDNAGCALPDGHIEAYAQHALNGWAYGIVEQTLRNGHIDDRAWVSMARLGELYG